VPNRYGKNFHFCILKIIRQRCFGFIVPAFWRANVGYLPVLSKIIKNNTK